MIRKNRVQPFDWLYPDNIKIGDGYYVDNEI